MYPKKIEKLIELFSKFPGVGPRTAARLVFYLLEEMDDKTINDLGQTILAMKQGLRRCNFCFNFFEPQSKKNICNICSNKKRDASVICVVEKEIDLEAIEKNKIYKGLYFVLGGNVSDLKKKNLQKLRIEELRQRIKNPELFGVKANFKEIILALNPTFEGDSTIIYLKKKLEDLNMKISVLGRGLPTGGEMEYADKKTLLSAFTGRRKIPMSDL